MTGECEWLRLDRDEWRPGCTDDYRYDRVHLPAGDYCPHCGRPKSLPLAWVEIEECEEDYRYAERGCS